MKSCMYRKGQIIPLKTKLIFTFSLMVIICLLIQVGISYIYFNNVVGKKTTEYFQETITQTNKRVDTSLYSYEKMTRNIISNVEIQRNLKKLQTKEIDPRNANYNIKQELANLTLAEENINSIHIVPMENKTIHYIFASDYVDYDALKELPWFEKIKDSTGRLLWLSTYPTNNKMIGKTKTFVFSGVRKINDLDTGKELGILILNLKETHLRKIINEVELGENGEVYLLNQDNQILSCKEEDKIGSSMNLEDINKDDYMIVSDTSSKNQWTIMGIVPKTEYTQDVEQLNRIFLYLSIIAIGAIIIFAYSISTSIVNPINTLINGMKEVERGNLDIKIKPKENNELGILAGHFDQMTDQLKYFIDKVYKQEISRREAELKALHAQLNPHFLYNTLDTIYWMLVMKEEDEIGNLVVALSNILRYSISSGEEFVTVQKDIEELKNYLNIQKVRFNEKLSYEIKVNSDIYDYKIPKLLLQPLVENSINHGFKKMQVEGKIKVIGYEKEEQIIFEVIDNGIGMSLEKIENIFNGNMNVDKQHTGLGIKAVDGRIKLLYGEDCGIEIDSIPDKMTKVILKFNLKAMRREI